LCIVGLIDLFSKETNELNYEELYQLKKCTPEQAISLIEDHKRIIINNKPIDLLKVLF